MNYCLWNGSKGWLLLDTSLRTKLKNYVPGVSGNVWSSSKPQGMIQNLICSLLSFSYIQSKADPCVFFGFKDQELNIIIIYVNDTLLIGTPEAILVFKDKIQTHYTIKDFGKLKKHFGFWYDWGKDKFGSYLQGSMESF